MADALAPAKTAISEELCLVKTWDGEQTDDTGSQD